MGYLLYILKDLRRKCLRVQRTLDVYIFQRPNTSSLLAELAPIRRPYQRLSTTWIPKPKSWPPVEIGGPPSSRDCVDASLEIVSSPESKNTWWNRQVFQNELACWLNHKIKAHQSMFLDVSFHVHRKGSLFHFRRIFDHCWEFDLRVSQKTHILKKKKTSWMAVKLCTQLCRQRTNTYLSM